ncbi:hypothetical protein ACH5RR_029298 [Cinchona calisaya]|uniref:Uncharacterized protein n=1 Tax=Cinchona calisaya TaxID=153742 RepID=A0ABD2YVP6_9GENT
MHVSCVMFHIQDKSKTNWKIRPRDIIDNDHAIENPYQDEHHSIVGTVLDNDPIGLLADTDGAYEETDDDALGRSTMVSMEEEEEEEENDEDENEFEEDEEEEEEEEEAE